MKKLFLSLVLLYSCTLVLPAFVSAQALNATATYLNNYVRSDGGLNDTMPNGDNFTFCAWVKRTGGAYTARTTIFQMEPSFSDSTFGTTAAGVLSVVINGSVVVSGGAVTAGVWKFACLLHTLNTFELWLGDESAAVTSQGSANNSKTFEGNAIQLFADDWNGYYLDGSIAYPRLWARQLNGAEIESERLSATPVNGTIHSYWDFTTASATISDGSGNGHTLTKAGTVTAVSGPSLSGGSVIPIRHRVIGQ